MKTFDAVEILNQKFGNTAEIREEIAEASINLQVSELIYQAHTDAGLTQKQIADLIGTQQSVIARLEDSDYDGDSLKMLHKIGVALNKKPCISFVEKAQLIQQSREMLNEGEAFENVLSFLRHNQCSKTKTIVLCFNLLSWCSRLVFFRFL